MSKKPKQGATDKAFLGSDKHTLSDLKLQPWTPDRILKAQEIGMLYPNLGKEGWAQFNRTNVYPGALKDVIIFVYLCTLEPGKVDEASYQEAKSFGVNRGLHQADGAAFWDAYNKFIEVQSEIRNSATKPVNAQEEEPDPNE